MMYESIRIVHAVSPAGKGGASGPPHSGALPAPREQLHTPHCPHEEARGRQLRTEHLVWSRKTEGGLMWKDGSTGRWTLLIATKRSELHGCGRREENSSRGNRR